MCRNCGKRRCPFTVTSVRMYGWDAICLCDSTPQIIADLDRQLEERP